MTAAFATKDFPGKDAARTKSPEAFRTISEVASELDVPQHVLRFWESRFAQVKPVKRAGGRRYYRPEDVDLLRGIRALLYHDGLTIKGVQKVLRDQGLKYVAEIGRGEATLINSPDREQSRAVPVDEPRYARAAFAALERALPAEETVEDAIVEDVQTGDADTLDEDVTDHAAEALDIDTPETIEAARDEDSADAEPPAIPAGLFDDQHHINAQAADVIAAPSLAPEQRTKLELLLSDLLVLKSRVRAARERAGR